MRLPLVFAAASALWWKLPSWAALDDGGDLGRVDAVEAQVQAARKSTPRWGGHSEFRRACGSGGAARTSVGTLGGLVRARVQLRAVVREPVDRNRARGLGIGTRT